MKKYPAISNSYDSFLILQILMTQLESQLKMLKTNIFFGLFLTQSS